MANSFSAKEVLFLERNGLIPHKLKSGWMKTVGGDPVHEARQVAFLGESCMAPLIALAVLTPLCATFVSLEYAREGGEPWATLIITLVGYALIVLAATPEQIRYRRIRRAFEDGFGHDVLQLHRFASGILRSGSDPQTIAEVYYAAMRRLGVYVQSAVGTPDGARAVSEINEMFDLGTRFRLHATLKGGWKQYLPKTATPAKSGVDEVAL